MAAVTSVSFGYSDINNHVSKSGVTVSISFVNITWSEGSNGYKNLNQADGVDEWKIIIDINSDTIPITRFNWKMYFAPQNKKTYDWNVTSTNANSHTDFDSRNNTTYNTSIARTWDDIFYYNNVYSDHIEYTTHTKYNTMGLGLKYWGDLKVELKTCTIGYYSDNTSYQIDTYNPGDTIVLPANPTKSHYTFTGWNPTVPATMPNNNLTVTAVFVANQHNITYKLDGETYHTSTARYGETVTVIAAPQVEEGYSFSGWSRTGAFSMPDSDVTITGSTTHVQYTLTYLLDGETYQTEQYYYNDTVTVIAAPTLQEHTSFSGWSRTGTFSMPAEDVTITGSIVQEQKYTLTYLLDGETYQTEQYYYNDTVTVIADPTAPEKKYFSGWSRTGTFSMPAEDVTITGTMEWIDQPIDHSWVAVDKIPVLREKLYDASTGDVRPGNRLEVKLSDKMKVLDEDENEIFIRRISVVLPNGNEQQTKYYIIVDQDAEADDKVITETWLKCTVDEQDVYYAAQIHESGKFTVDVETTAEETPEEFYVLTEDVRMSEDEKFYEQVQNNSTEEIIDGAELFVVNKFRPEYKHFTEGVPDMITPEEGDPYTAWIQKWGVVNDHNEAIYSEELKLEDLEQIEINQVIYDESIPYTVQTTDAVYPWTYYPAGDFYLIEQDGCEAAAEHLTKTNYACKGAALFGNILNVYFVSAAEAEGYAAVYIMDGDDRISMVIGKPGYEVELPEELKKLGYNFKGYETPVPTHFTAAAQSVNTIWEKIDDTEEDDTTPKHKATWTVPNKNWSYSVNVEVGSQVPAAPQPAIENISITSWTLKSEAFADNEMPDYDILYEAVFTETTPAQIPKHNLVYQIQYTTEDNQQHTDTYKTYSIEEGAAITPEPSPYKRGGTFQGWTNLPAYMPQNDVTVTGTFSGKVKNSITITYYVDGQVHTTQTYTPGDAVTAPQNPTQSGKVFSGWIGVPQTAPSYNMEVQGYFYDDTSDLVTIRYVVDNQTYKTYRLLKGATLPAEPAPVKTGYTFSGWSPVLTIVPNVDTTISGTFTQDQPAATKYDLKFYLTDENSQNQSLYAQYKLAAGEAIVAPTCDVDGFLGWQNVPQTMPAQNLNIYGPVSSTLDFAVNCVYEYTKADGTKDNVKGISYLLAAGAQFVYPNHNPDQTHADYIWKGWTGDSDVVNNIMPAHEVNLVGHFIAPDIDDGEKEDNARIEWRLPNYDGSNDPYDVYKFEYVPFGQALVAPENVPNYTGADGYTYQFNSWGTYPANAPSSTDVLHIDGTSTRLSQQFNVKYYLYVYELGAADATKVLYKTIQVYPGTSMATVHAQAAADISTDYPDYLWKGVWYQQSFYADETTMGWFDRAYYSHIYSPEYAEQTGVTVAGKHKVMYKTRSYAPGLAPDYTPYVDSVHTYKVTDTQWVSEGDTFTDPTGPFDAPFPNGSKFAFAGWEEHSNVMGTSDITVWASWSYVTYPCEISWIIKYINQNAEITEETYLVTVQQQGTALQWPEEPTAPENYVWAGWDVPTYPGMTNLVWREPVHVVYGKMVHINSGECPSGFAYAKYLLKTHDTKYPPDRYITYQTIIAPCNGPIPQATGTPADWLGLDGNMYHFIEWKYPQSTMPYYGGGTVEIVAQDALVATQKIFTMELWYQGNGHNEKEVWNTIEVYPGTPLEQTVTNYITENGEPSKTGFVWSGIWSSDFDEMPNFDCKATTIMWDEDYFNEVHPASDEYFIIEWVSPYWRGYWRPQDRWTVKQEVVKQGTLITPPADPVMPNHENEYNFIGWTGLPASMIMPRNNLTITANWEEVYAHGTVIWNMAIPQENGTVVFEEYFRREIDLSTASYTGAEAAIGPWPSNPAGDETKQFVQWCQPKDESSTSSQWIPMQPADDYNIYYNPNQSNQEYLIGTALMKSLIWDGGSLSGYTRVYWQIPSLIKHHTGYIEYEWTTWKFFYVANGSVIATPQETPQNVKDFEGYDNEFKRWPSHETTASGTDIIIQAEYDRAQVRYTIRYYGVYYDRNGVSTYEPSTKLLLTCRAYGGAYIDMQPTSDPPNWEFHYHRLNVPRGSHFWAVINDNSGAPLWSTWDGTCLHRDMDLAAELWLTGEDGSPYVPEEYVKFLQWPEGDNMDHSGGGTGSEGTVMFLDIDETVIKEYKKRIGGFLSRPTKDEMRAYCTSVGKNYDNFMQWHGIPSDNLIHSSLTKIYAVWRDLMPQTVTITLYDDWDESNVLHQWTGNQGAVIENMDINVTDYIPAKTGFTTVSWLGRYLDYTKMPIGHFVSGGSYVRGYEIERLQKLFSFYDGFIWPTCFRYDRYKDVYDNLIAIDYGAQLLYNIKMYAWYDRETSVSDYAFENDQSKMSVLFKKPIGKYAFSNSNIQAAFICRGAVLSESAFEGSKLRVISIEVILIDDEDVGNVDGTIIPSKCFKNCEDLQAVFWEDSILNHHVIIEDMAFENSGLRFYSSLNVYGIYPTSVCVADYIGYRAFANCKNLEWVQLVRTKVISDEAFANCPKLETLYVYGSSERTPIPASAFSGCPKFRYISTRGSLAPLMRVKELLTFNVDIYLWSGYFWCGWNELDEDTDRCDLTGHTLHVYTTYTNQENETFHKIFGNPLIILYNSTSEWPLSVRMSMYENSYGLIGPDLD